MLILAASAIYAGLVLLAYFGSDDIRELLSKLGLESFRVTYSDHPLGATYEYPFVFPRLALGGEQNSNPIIGAALFGFSIILGVREYCLSTRKLAKCFLASLVLISFFVMMLYQSRGPLISLFITAIMVAGFMLNRPNAAIRRKPILKVFFILFSVYLGLMFLNGLTFDRLYTGSRLNIFEQCAPTSVLELTFGRGWNQDQAVHLDGKVFAHCHSIYVTTLRDTGIVGLLMFLAVPSYLIVSRYNNSVSYITWTASLFFGGLALASDGSYPLTNPSYIWILWWLPISMLAGLPYSKRHLKTLQKLLCIYGIETKNVTQC
ncbi:hypothetical protein N8993_11565 [Pseudomonadales bacterium]|nr:hypothetical protein [Pseudomonadales bacterium]MDB2543308.1 hypothetical protein [Pseudomonadales bacterium]